MRRELIITYVEQTGNVDFHLPEKKTKKNNNKLIIHVAVGAD
jgi:hypothetical protein